MIKLRYNSSRLTAPKWKRDCIKYNPKSGCIDKTKKVCNAHNCKSFKSKHERN